MPTKAHHLAWMEGNHAEPDFLYQAIMNGFQVHHVDGDHSNNDPLNLVLIYDRDHKKLHGLTFHRFDESSQEPRKWEDLRGYYEERVNKGKAAYELRQTPMTWKQVAEKMECQASNALQYAQAYARAKRLPWPPIMPEGYEGRKGGAAMRKAMREKP